MISVNCFGDLLRSEQALNDSASPNIKSDKLSMRDLGLESTSFPDESKLFFLVFDAEI